MRSLCEFTAKRGDLDRRFTPSATALEGLQAQAAIAARRGPGYETEIALERTVDGLRVRGRADGYDAPRHCLEEIKAIRGTPEQIPANRRRLHWAQLETYAALFCRARGHAAIELALVYVDGATLQETVQREQRSADELEAAYVERCARFAAWAAQEAAHRRARDAALDALPFPPGAFRPGQRALAGAVYRTALRGGALLAQAPTGIGKTIGTLYPLLRAMPAAGLDKVGFLTCKTTGRVAALDALGALRAALPRPALRVLALVGREQACEHPQSACHGDSCPLARGFYDRLPEARAQAVDAGWLDPAALRTIALRHAVCPYYLGQELLRWADVVVGDVHHVFDPHGQLHALAQALDWRVGLLVDEAHNLVERARRMYSADIDSGVLRAALALAPPAVRPGIGRLLQALTGAAAAQDDDYAAHPALPAAVAAALQSCTSALGEHLEREPLATGPLLGLHFAALRLQRLAERGGEHALFDIERRGGEARLSLRNVVPAPFLKARFAACATVTLFSATLGGADYQRDLLGLPDDTGWLDVPPPFDPANLRVRIAAGVSTRYPDRAASTDALVALLARQFDARPGNYLAFFSSFEYLERVARRLAELRPDLPAWRQARTMDAGERQAFLDRFVPDGRGIGFAVLGGVFAEGVDLPGTRLVGAFVATLGLPPVTPVQQQIRTRLEALFGAEHGYADIVPGLQKVVQAAGRVLRTPADRGVLWLIDDRYRQRRVQRLLPPWWQLPGRVLEADAGR